MSRGRTYTDDEKKAAVAAVDVNQGDISKTAKQLGINRRTLDGWLTTAQKQAKENPTALISPQTDMARIWERMARIMLRRIPKAARGDSRMLSALTTGASIATEKMLLLEGKATSRSEHVKVDPREQALALLAFLREQKQVKQVELLPSPDPTPPVSETTAPNSGETHP